MSNNRFSQQQMNYNGYYSPSMGNNQYNHQLISYDGYKNPLMNHNRYHPINHGRCGY